MSSLQRQLYWTWVAIAFVFAVAWFNSDKIQYRMFDDKIVMDKYAELKQELDTKADINKIKPSAFKKKKKNIGCFNHIALVHSQP